MQTADFNYNDFQMAQQREMDKRLLVRFYIKPLEDKTATEKEGRPMFNEVEYIEIRIPGHRDPQVARPATYSDKQRFPEHYEAWKKRAEMPTEGTPLAEWPQISRTQVEELSFLHVKTVEQLSDIADVAISTVRGGLMLKERAQKWLQASEKTELIAEKEAMQKQMAAMQEQMDKMQAQQESMVAQAATPKPKGRPRKKAAAEE